MGTGFRKCSFSRPDHRVTTMPARSSTRRCFMTPKRVISNRDSSSVRVLAIAFEQQVEEVIDVSDPPVP